MTDEESPAALPLHATLFDAFRTAALTDGVYPKYQNTDRRFRQKFCKWQDFAGAYRLTFDGCAYDRAWLFVPDARETDQRHYTSAAKGIRVYMVAVNPSNGTIALYTATWDSDCLSGVLRDHQWISQEIKKILHPLSDIGTPIIRPDSVIYSSTPKLTPLCKNYSALRKIVLSGLPALRDAFSDAAIRVLNRDKGMDIARKHAAHGLAMASFENHVPPHFQDALNEIESYMDLDALRVAENCSYPENLPDKGHVLYNLLMLAPAGPSRYRRMSVLPILARGDLYYLGSSRFWTSIDNGASPFAALGQQLNVSPGTIRHMLRQGDETSSLYAGRFESVAPYLDSMPVGRWPKTPQDVSFMQDIIKMARDYSHTFKQHQPPKVLAQWVKDAGPHMSWRRLFTRKTRPHIVSKLKNPFRETGHTPSLAAYLRFLLDSPVFRRSCVEWHNDRLNEIKDLKRDITRRLVVPAILRTIVPTGTQNHFPNMAAELTEPVSQKLWQNCPPSEQLAASAYWHSPRVDFSTRFKAVSRTTGLTWHTIFDAPLTIDDVTAVPLGSDATLREEADAMQHCVWSFGPRCLEDGYHIFSLRDLHGNRLSTLSLVETRHGDGRITFSVAQNRTVLNDMPLAAAQTYGETLCRMLGDGSLAIDWAPILADRAAYAIHKATGEAGYDFNDPAIAQDVFKLYEPCLPRKIARASGGTLDGFAQALGIRDMIATSYLKHFFPLHPDRPAAP